MACEGRAFGASRLGGARFVADVEQLECDAAAIEPLALAQEQQSIAGELPVRAAPFACNVQERASGMRLPIDLEQIDLVDVGLLAIDGVGLDGIDGERQRGALV